MNERSTAPETARPAAVDSGPFFFEAGSDAAVLLIHGFTGTPYEVRGLGLALAEAGITARGIRLPGHESSEALNCATRDDWRRAVRAAFLDLKDRYRHVGVAGLSMGGLLSLDLAADPQLPVEAVEQVGQVLVEGVGVELEV